MLFPNLPRAQGIFVVFGAEKQLARSSVVFMMLAFFAMCVTRASMPGDISDALLAAAVCSSVVGFRFLLNVGPESYVPACARNPECVTL